MPTSSFWLRVAAVSGASAVLLGAFGAHGLRHLDEKSLKSWTTASQYHLVHSVALLYGARSANPRLACSLLSAGIALFSGSLYAHALTGYKVFGAIAPIGGVSYVLGWLALAPWTTFVGSD